MISYAFKAYGRHYQGIKKFKNKKDTSGVKRDTWNVIQRTILTCTKSSLKCKPSKYILLGVWLPFHDTLLTLPTSCILSRSRITWFEIYEASLEDLKFTKRKLFTYFLVHYDTVDYFNISKCFGQFCDYWLIHWSSDQLTPALWKYTCVFLKGF